MIPVTSVADLEAAASLVRGFAAQYFYLQLARLCNLQQNMRTGTTAIRVCLGKNITLQRWHPAFRSSSITWPFLRVHDPTCSSLAGTRIYNCTSHVRLRSLTSVYFSDPTSVRSISGRISTSPAQSHHGDGGSGVESLTQEGATGLGQPQRCHRHCCLCYCLPHGNSAETGVLQTPTPRLSLQSLSSLLPLRGDEERLEEYPCPGQ